MVSINSFKKVRRVFDHQHRLAGFEIKCLLSGLQELESELVSLMEGYNDQCAIATSNCFFGLLDGYLYSAFTRMDQLKDLINAKEQKFIALKAEFETYDQQLRAIDRVLEKFEKIEKLRVCNENYAMTDRFASLKRFLNK